MIERWSEIVETKAIAKSEKKMKSDIEWSRDETRKKENQQTVRAHKRKVNYNEGELCSGKQKNEAQINAHHFGKNLNK